jgi:hypothetical protein
MHPERLTRIQRSLAAEDLDGWLPYDFRGSDPFACRLLGLPESPATTRLAHTRFSIEPGIYLPGRFGVRREIDVYLAGDDAVITGQPVQTEVVPILAARA